MLDFSGERTVGHAAALWALLLLAVGCAPDKKQHVSAAQAEHEVDEQAS